MATPCVYIHDGRLCGVCMRSTYMCATAAKRPAGQRQSTEAHGPGCAVGSIAPSQALPQPHTYPWRCGRDCRHRVILMLSTLPPCRLPPSTLRVAQLSQIASSH
eukprot:scaffold32813_cov129-Isochrysis_galbana.AAC.2